MIDCINQSNFFCGLIRDGLSTNCVPQLLRQSPHFTITLCGKPISSTPVGKDLGVFLDQCLSYDEHIYVKLLLVVYTNWSRSIELSMYVIRKHFFLIINSFVFSRLFYCSSVWSNASATNIHKLQLVQNFAARIFLILCKYDHTCISSGQT